MTDVGPGIRQLEHELRLLRDRCSATQAEIEASRQQISDLVGDLGRRDRALAEALEQQAATAEILRVIASSPTDARQIVASVVESAGRLSHSPGVLLALRERGQLRVAATIGSPPRALAIGDAVPLTLRRPSVRSFLERRTIHQPNASVPAALAEFPDQVNRRDSAILTVPLVREGDAIGVLQVDRDIARPYTEREIALVQTFAHQVVIAIETTRLCEALQEKSRQLEAASRHKSQFLANMSHELRTPLNSIIGFSGVLAEQMFGQLNDRQSEYVRDIQTSGQYLLSLINDILDLSKVEAGRMDVDIRAISLRETLEHALTMVRERAIRHGISIGLEMDPGLDEIEADERKLKQVILNLISNAVKFTPDGGQVALRAWRADDEVHIDVVDTGVGIATRDLEHLFDDFRQVGSGTSNDEGTGLGLAISRHFCRLMGGDLTVKSVYGQGSTFTVRLPAEAAPTVAS